MGSLYLTAPATVWSGAARLFDFGNTFDSYNRTEHPSEADGLAIFWDWVMVGNALWQAASDYEDEVGSSHPTRVEVVSR